MGHQAEYLNPPPGRASRFARFVSSALNPVTAGLFIAGLTAVKTINSPWATFFWFAIMACLTVVPPLGYIIYLVRIGYLTDIYMPNRKRRIKPVAFIVVWTFISTILLGLIGAPQAISIILIIGLILIGLLLTITLLWKISFHTGILTTAVTLTVFFDTPHAWFITLLVPLVGWSRVHLRRHTLLQVIGGCVAGWLVAILADTALLPYLGL